MKKRIKKIKRRLNLIWPMVAIWTFVFGISVVVMFTVDATTENVLRMPGFRMIGLVIAFATFVMTTLFSFLILSHNITTRQMGQLQFAASNYSVVEFFGDMLMYEQYATYTERLKQTKDCSFFLRQEDIDLDDIVENFDNYIFLSVKIPFRVIEGKRIAGIRVTRFRFAREEAKYRFVPCSSDVNTLILYDDVTKTNTILAGLVIKKDCDFWSRDAVAPFGKIKLNLSMRSLLGVEVSGWIELYFTNPRKLDKDGANLYNINSTQFQVSGLPVVAKNIRTES